MLLLNVAKQLLQREDKVPEEFMRLIKNEYRSVSPEYVEYFYDKNSRLPTPEELQDAI